MSDLLPRTLGHLIAELGQARDNGTITHAQAVTQLRAADPSLHEQGATGQLNAWTTAISRYAHLAPTRSGARPVDARTLTARQPIVFRFPVGGAA